MCYRMGCDRATIRTMSLRAFILRLQAHRGVQRTEWQRTLALVNTVRALAGSEPIGMSDLQRRGAEPGDTNHEAYEAFKGRHIDWITTDAS